MPTDTGYFPYDIPGTQKLGSKSIIRKGGLDLVSDPLRGGLETFPFTGGSQEPTPSNGAVLGANTTANANSGGSGGSGQSNTDAADLAYLSDQEGLLRRLLDSAGRTLKDGLTQIGDSYKTSVNTGERQRADAREGFITKREDTTRDKVDAVGQVNTNARTLSDSVRRILALSGGTNSSAYQEVAPSAIARDATISRTGVNDTFGRNLRDLATAQDETESGFEDYFEELKQNRKSTESDLRAGVIGQEQNILGDLAEVARQRAIIGGGGGESVRSAIQPFSADIASRQNELDGLFSKFRTPAAVKPVEVSAPQLSDFTVDRQAINAQNQTGTSDATSPYSQFLRRKFQEA